MVRTMPASAYAGAGFFVNILRDYEKDTVFSMALLYEPGHRARTEGIGACV